MQAASAGQIGLIQAILQSGEDISMQADDGSTALHCAAKAGQIETIRFLIAQGARSNILNENRRTPLHEAISHSRTSAVRVLMERRADITEHALRALFKSGQNRLFEEVWLRCDKRVFEKIGPELLSIAARSTSTATMATLTSLLETTQQWISEIGRPIISRIIAKDQIAMLECLLESGKLDPNMRSSNRNGGRLIHLAAAKGRVEIVDLLLESETIAPNLLCGKMSPLGIAAARGHLRVVERLLEHPGVIVGDEDGRGQDIKSPLHLACHGRHAQTIRLMLKAYDDRSLDVDGLDKFHPRMSPLQIAVFNGDVDLVKHLLLREDVDVNRLYRRSRLNIRQLAMQRKDAKTLSVLLGDKRMDLEDASNSRQALVHEAIAGEHWWLAEVLLNYEKVFLNTIQQNLEAPVEPSKKHADILGEYLLDVASSPHKMDSFWHQVAREGNLSLAMLLLEDHQTRDDLTHPNVDVNQKDSSGQTPLHVAVKSTNISIVDLLLHHNDIDIHSRIQRGNGELGQSAIEMAVRNMEKWSNRQNQEHSYIVDLLQAHGARVAAGDREDDANNTNLPPLLRSVESENPHSAEHSEDLRRRSHPSWASVIGIMSSGDAPRETRRGVDDTVGDTIPMDVDYGMAEDPDVMFEELMCFDDEDMSDNNSIEMLEREMFGESPDRFTAFWEGQVT